MNRREFITLLGGAAAWPLVAGAQQAIPVIGYLGSGSPAGYALRLAAFNQGLKEAGLVDGENIRIEYRWADDQYDRLPALAAELVRLQAAVIVAAGGGQTALAAKAATTTIPIVFQNGSDPVELGLVASLNRPSGNITGATVVSTEIVPKRVELMRELVPDGGPIGWLANPHNPNSERNARELQGASRTLGRQVLILNAANESELDEAFVQLSLHNASGVVIGADPIFTNRLAHLLRLMASYRIPTQFPSREHAEAGGLMSYGASALDALRQVANYTARILKGAKPGDLPVLQPTKFELLINLRTAKALRLEIPARLMALADGVIE